MLEERCSTGIEGLDPLIEGGFPRGSLVLLAGRPGSGKTVFSATFLYRGIVDYGEPGIYVSYSEDANTFMKNMRGFGFDFQKYIESDRFRFLDLVTVKDHGVSSTLEIMLNEIGSMKAERLVLDSFSALASGLRDPADTRIILHTILGKIARQAGCTTLIIDEMPIGAKTVGRGLEEFVVDSLIVLKRRAFKERVVREMEIVKLRAARIGQAKHLFTLHDGFKVFKPFSFVESVKPVPRQAMPDREGYFSTGSVDLDQLLGGGFYKGSYVLMEVGEDVPELGWRLILACLSQNAALNGHGVLVYPPAGIDAEEILRFSSPFIGAERFNKHYRIIEHENPEVDQRKPYIVVSKARTIKDEYDVRLKAEEELTRNTGKPIVYIYGLDSLEYRYEEEYEEMHGLLSTAVARTRAIGILVVSVAKPGLRLTQAVANMANIHLKISAFRGCVLLQGIRPRTELHIVEQDLSKGYPEVKLTPIV